MYDLKKRVRSGKVILLFELLIVIVYGLAAASSYRSQELQFEESEMQIRNGQHEMTDGNYLDTSFTEAKAVVTPAFSLTKGIYYLEASYAGKGTIYAGLLYDRSRNGKEAVDNDEFIINPEDQTIAYRIKIHDDSEIRFKMRLTGDAADGDYVQLFRMHIVSSRLTYVYNIFCLFSLFLLGDLVVWGYRRYYVRWNTEQKMVFMVLAFSAFFMGLPLYRDGLNGGNDLTFHLSRIEGLYRSLQHFGKNRQLPVRIQPGWLDGYGYAVSVFYGDIFLYLPAVLRVIGFTLEEAYKVYVWTVNAATVFLSFYAFKRIARDRLAAMMGSVLYAGSVQRLTLLYTAVLGSGSGMAFYPLVAAGFYLLFTEDIYSETYKRIWMLLALGFTGILMTHMLSCLMVGAYALLLCVIMLKKTLRRNTLCTLFKAAGAAILLNLWYLIPMIQYMICEKLRINTALSTEVEITDYYARLSDFTQEGRNLYSFFTGNDTIGFSVLLVLLLYVISMPLHKKDRKTTYCRMVACLALFASAVCTDLFPVVELARRSALLTRFFLTLQYQYRLMGIAVVLAVCLCVLFLSMDVFDRKMLSYSMGLLCCLTLYQDVQYFRTLSCDQVYLDGIALEARMDQEQYSYHVGNGEYLPTVTDTKKFTREVEGDEQIRIDRIEREGLTFAVAAENEFSAERTILFPVLYYSGYQASDQNTREKLATGIGDNGRVAVTVPSGYNGTFCLRYREPLLWRIAEAVSVSAWIAVVFFFVRPFSFRK